MPNTRFPYAKTFLLGIGFFGISLIWPIFNNYVPVFLKEDFGLSAALIGFIMTWDNYLNMFVQPIVGERSDQTYTRIGRRKPWILVGLGHLWQQYFSFSFLWLARSRVS